MKPTIDQRLDDARPENTRGDDVFVARTMEAVGRAATSETFSKAVRTTSTTKSGAFRMKLSSYKRHLLALPRLAFIAIILGTTGTVGAAAYATYQWVVPNATVTDVNQNNDDNRRQYTVNGQCGQYYSGQDLKYEIAQNSGLSDDDARKVLQNTCIYDALGSFIETRFVSDNDAKSMARKKVGDTVTMYTHDNIFPGNPNANPIFGLTTGYVTDISPKSITITLTLYRVDNSFDYKSGRPFEYYPEGKSVSRTIAVAPDVQVFENGKPIQLSDVSVGSVVQLVTRTQHLVQYYQDLHGNGLGPQTGFAVAGIIKTDLDPKFVGGVGSEIGDPQIANAVAKLGPCTENVSYYCVNVPNQILGVVYTTADETSQANDKYRRTDVTNNGPVKFHQLHGRIKSIDGTKVTLQARGSTKTFTVDLPYDAISQYNGAGNALKVNVGDLMEVDYLQPPDEDHLKVKSSDLIMFGLLEQTQVDGSVAKY